VQECPGGGAVQADLQNGIITVHIPAVRCRQIQQSDLQKIVCNSNRQ
jgi:hypothetical protein